MTALEAYDSITHSGGTDFGRLIQACESFGAYCLIGDLAVNCYVEPVYTLDADLVVVSSVLDNLAAHPALSEGSDLRVQFTTDERYQTFLARAIQAEVLGLRVRIACLEDVVQGKLWAYGDPNRRLSKRKKDELDLIRLAEAYHRVRSVLPIEILDQLESR